ncbi:PaaI family thioesterase [Alcanivorax sp. 1008]|uniref:PaaI family thioesterase n=1 Tax=Alcanivorax sp. 1008 TaxID=2816853 RepID=UPI001D2C9F4C|nr:PaaI family thioesterase [Alcanivorax sp. 1008]MCC1497282.1 PaaI family thioesterase [Alcanivorax sp. 1008]
MPEKKWGPFELLSAHDSDVPQTFVIRRRIAAAMQQLSERLIRVEADDADLEQWATTLEGLLETMGTPPRRNTREANRRLFTGQASTFDVFDMMDYDPVGGLSNPIAPQLRWRTQTAEGVEGQISLGEHYQGPPGRVHGGVIAWILDALLSRAMHAALKIGVTGTLNIRYMASTPIDTQLRCTARIVRMEGRKMFIEGAIFNGEQQTVQAEGIFLQPDFSKRK